MSFSRLITILYLLVVFVARTITKRSSVQIMGTPWWHQCVISEERCGFFIVKGHHKLQWTVGCAFFWLVLVVLYLMNWTFVPLPFNFSNDRFLAFLDIFRFPKILHPPPTLSLYSTFLGSCLCNMQPCKMRKTIKKVIMENEWNRRKKCLLLWKADSLFCRLVCVSVGAWRLCAKAELLRDHEGCWPP